MNQSNNSNITNNTRELSRARRGKSWRNAALLGAAAAGALLTTQPSRAGSIFVIAMENHNLTQPIPTNSPQQILNNPAAPFLNSLMTPGSSNSVQVSFATAYYNAGMKVHPSEPNYVWAEAGSDFGVHTDADPRATNGNTFFDNSIHLAAQLDAAGISWKNYQEDVQLSVSPTNSASGTNAPVANPFYGTTQYNYAVKHNPFAFFADSAAKNVYALSQLFSDLTNETTGSYNWITPNQFDDAHSALNGGFTYQGTQFAGDQASIAQGDNFLSIIVPEIMASKAYQDNGAIIIWWDESEDGDTTNFAIPEIVISPLAKGNAYASTVVMNHSSDIKTWEEVFGLSFINNSIPITETNNFGGFNNVATVNDLSDLFMTGVIPSPATFSVTSGRIETNPRTGRAIQRVEIKNTSDTPAHVPLFLVLDNLSSNATLVNSGGLKTTILAPVSSPYVSVSLNNRGFGGLEFGPVANLENILLPYQSTTVTLEFLNPSGDAITYTPRVLSVTPTP
ncbi:MAG TPA: alkaline phosphatase family protein [Verrucomicrobiae bacterium]|jgi:hypothetical protein|nr:alkaline phosphatase family protein [Verrucomicrobiae bacterium]